MAKWIIKQNRYNMEQGRFGVPASIVQIIRDRGVEESKIEDFLSETPKVTYDPFLLPDLRDAAQTLINTAKLGKRICVYGDYDADGVTSTTLLYTVIRYLTENVCYYVPSRFTDGYGLNNAAIDKIKANNVDLLITVDCGSTSPAEVEYAKSLGMEVIITDHHRLRDGQDPDCLFVNPKRAESNYPFAELSGCGVAFKLAQGVKRILEAQGDLTLTKSRLNNLLDLVAISTVADVVPLLDENRSLVKYGLDRINRRSRIGLTSLFERLEINDKIITSSNVAFILAPNLNALGRMDSAALGVELLAGFESKSQLDALADETVRTNIKRKSVQEETYRICERALETEDCGEFAPVIFAPGAHEGVAGIVAGNLKERFHKPVCIVTPAEDGSLKGTGRSVPGINLHELFENCGDVFLRFGGHAGACGFSLKAECLDEFRQKMQELVKAQVELNADVLEECLVIEKELAENEKTLEFAEKLQKLEPYGEANPVPLFCVRGAHISNAFTMGSDGQHMRFNIVAADGIGISCILFQSAADFRDLVFSGQRVDVAGELEINEYRGERKLQIKVKDIRVSK
ncbi:MAG: single-stranded-DNA-specific exonuclease RecJ [Clostridia bacterium]|nr:single-stranded-DNA-specific exonuclease RecJ [Clostridia bacterium]